MNAIDAARLRARLEMTKEERARLQHGLDELQLSPANDYRWEPGNILYLYEDEDAERLAEELRARGHAVQIEWVPDPAAFGGTVLAYVRTERPGPDIAPAGHGVGRGVHGYRGRPTR
jgi:hypothetical protein